MAIHLNAAERKRFAAWLEEHLSDNNKLIESMQTMPGEIIQKLIQTRQQENQAITLVIALILATHGE